MGRVVGPLLLTARSDDTDIHLVELLDGLVDRLLTPGDLEYIGLYGKGIAATTLNVAGYRQGITLARAAIRCDLCPFTS